MIACLDVDAAWRFKIAVVGNQRHPFPLAIWPDDSVDTRAGVTCDHIPVVSDLCRAFQDAFHSFIRRERFVLLNAQRRQQTIHWPEFSEWRLLLKDLVQLLPILNVVLPF